LSRPHRLLETCSEACDQLIHFDGDKVEVLAEIKLDTRYHRWYRVNATQYLLNNTDAFVERVKDELK
jgi:hypothetical protein